MRARTFSFAAEPLEPVGVPAYVPCPMTHPRADVAVTTRPRVIAPGVALLPPLPRMLFWPGYIAEQAAGTPLVPQAVLGNPYPPWQPISERDAVHVLDEIEARGPRLVALSGHDSTPWTFGAFAARLGERYRSLRAGDELTISATIAGTKARHPS